MSIVLFYMEYRNLICFFNQLSALSIFSYYVTFCLHILELESIR